MSYIDIIKEKARSDSKTIVLPETNDKRTLIAASHIIEEGIANIIMVGNEENSLRELGKAGAKRWRGIRPTVRGVAMNPVDHPHGGGEGKSPIGHPSPVTPWGKPALGYKTRNKKARTDKLIVKRRNAK